MKLSPAYITALLLPVTLGAPNCPPLGPVFPKPSSQALLSSASVQAAIANLTATFTARDADNSTGAYSTSYSIEVWSASDAPGTTIFSWHHTAPNLTTASFNASGVRKVDKNTVYRLGSLTKIFTIYTWLVQDGDTRWNEPITKYVPELAAVADKAKSDPVDNVDWGEVTIGALASQMAGIVRDCEFNLQEDMDCLSLTKLVRRFAGRAHAGEEPDRGRVVRIPAAERLGPDTAQVRRVAAVQQDRCESPPLRHNSRGERKIGM